MESKFDGASFALNVIFGIFTVIGTVTSLWVLGLSNKILSGPELAMAAALLSIPCAAFHSILWRLFERYFGTDAMASTFITTPKGLEAIALSISLTAPIVIIPAFLSLYPKIDVVRNDSWITYVVAAVAFIVGGALSHLIMYGVADISGLKERLYPPGVVATIGRAILTEVVYGVVYFTCMLVPYRLVLGCLGWKGSATIVVSLIGWLAVMVILIGLFPRSIADEGGVQVRGMVSGFALVFFLLQGTLL